MKKFYKTFVAAAVLMAAQATTALAGNVTTVYERSIANEEGIQVWDAEADIAEGQWSGNGSVSADYGMMVQGAKSSPSATISLANIEDGVILTYDISWYSSTTYNDGYFSKIQLGNGVVFNAYGNGRVSATVNGTESTKVSIAGNKAAANLSVHYVVNTATNTVTALSIKETTDEGEAELVSLASFGDGVTSLSLTNEPTYTGVTISTKSANKARTTICGLKSIKVVQETQQLQAFGYTVNYKYEGAIVKEVTGSLPAGATIPVLTAIDGDDDVHYLMVADEAPVQAVTADASQNVLNIDVRRPYSTTLSVYRVLDGVKEAEPFITKELTETDAKVAQWVYTFPLCVQVDGAWYQASLKDDKFGEQGTFTNDALEKTVDYTFNPDIVGFWDESHNGTVDNMAYSGGSFNTYWRETQIGTLEAGTYELTAMQIGNYGCTLYSGFVSADERGAEIAKFDKDNRSQVFELEEPAENVRLYLGSNGRMDYVLLQKTTKQPTTGIESIEHSTLNIDHSVYNLQGRRMESSMFNIQSSMLKKGLYIMNGRKVVIK